MKPMAPETARLGFDPGHAWTCIAHHSVAIKGMNTNTMVNNAWQNRTHVLAAHHAANKIK
jgi:hypothetical protein